MSALPQRPSSIIEILAFSFNLYVESFTKWIGYSLIVSIISESLIKNEDSIILFIFDNNAESYTEMRDPENLDRITTIMQFGFLGITLITTLLTCVFYSAIICRIDNLVNKRKDNFFEILLIAFKKLPTIFWAMILFCVVAIIITNILSAVIGYFFINTVYMAVTFSLFLAAYLVIPSIILSFSLSFFWYFILLEDLGGYQSLKASHRLVWGNWWRTLCVFLIPSLGIGFISSFGVLLSFLPLLVIALSIPYFFVLGYLQYHDLKLRKI